jgi:hypothetical protein
MIRRRYSLAIVDGGRREGDGSGHAAHLDCLEFFWRVDRMEQYPITLEDRRRGEEFVGLL